MNSGTEDEAFKVFAFLHPIEAYTLNNVRFCNYMRSKGYNMTDLQIKQLIDSL